jgi:hypothetical protein
MRLIVDTNQADPIRFTHKQLPAKDRPTLVIPHRVWTELLIGNVADKRRRALMKFPLLFGMDIVAVFDELSQRSEDRIRTLVPVYAEGSDEHEIFRKTFLYPTPGQIRQAKELRADGVKYRQRVSGNWSLIRKKHKDKKNAAKSRGETLEYEWWYTIRDCEHQLFLKDDAAYRLWLIKEVSTDANGKPRPIAAKSGQAMFDAVWDNPILRRFLRMQAAVRLGYAHVWEDPKLNRDVRMGNDDDPDMELVLYACDGDTILSADAATQYRIRFIDAEKSIDVTTWDAWLATQAQPAQ